jgi:hypothetical protein
MDDKTKNILFVSGLIFALLLIMHSVKVVPTTTTTKTTTTKVVYKKPNVYTTTVSPHYNAYKSQYYN